MLIPQCISIFESQLHLAVSIHAVPRYGGLARGECDELSHVEICALVDTLLNTSGRTQQRHQDEHTPPNGESCQPDALAVVLHGGSYLIDDIPHFSSLNMTPSLKNILRSV